MNGVIPPPLTCLRGVDREKLTFTLIYAGHTEFIVEIQFRAIVDPTPYRMEYCVSHC
jgi:hypothetical protein